MDIQILVPEEFVEIIADAIFELAKEHRYNCDGNCNISLYPFRCLVEELLGRPLTHEEFKILS